MNDCYKINGVIYYFYWVFFWEFIRNLLSDLLLFFYGLLLDYYYSAYSRFLFYNYDGDNDNIGDFLMPTYCNLYLFS